MSRSTQYPLTYHLPPVHCNVGLSEPELHLQLRDLLVYRWRVVEVAVCPEICRNRMARDTDRVPLPQKEEEKSVWVWGGGSSEQVPNNKKRSRTV